VAQPGNERFSTRILRIAALAAAAIGWAWSLPAWAQYGAAVPVQGMSPEQAKAMIEAQRAAAMAQAQANQPQPAKEEKKDESKDAKKKGDDKDKKKEEETSIKRPEKPPRTPDPREFDVKLDDRGRVPPFNFIGQPWPDVLQWLANVSKCSLDWQELPSDYLNLTTQRPYALDEVCDLINRHLTARGYTMLVGGEVLSVVKIEKLDPSLVPRVTEDQLYDRKPYDFVKVSFELPESMAVDKAKDDFKQLLSPHAKIFPLAATKRILVIDVVANLRTVSELLNQERLIADGRIVPREFVLKHARAEQVIDVLYVMVGLDPKSRPTQMELQLQQQRLQIMTQMQQKGTDVSKMLGKDGPPVYLAYNRQRNSVLANAPPEFMRIIEQAIKYLDVPQSGDDVGDLGAPADNGREFRKYQLVTLDPEKLMMTLEEIGSLDPWTEMRADAKSKCLWVQASAADHVRIAQLIKQFDGEGREFYVIQLRRLAADLAAVSIKELIFGEEKKEDDSNRRPYYYFYGQQQQQKEENPHDGFRVVADVERNRLLLRANDSEMADVRNLLAQMGEVPAGASAPRPVRFIQPPSGAGAEAMLDELRRLWPDVGAGELIIRVPEEKPKPAPPEKKPTADSEDQGEDVAVDQSAAVDRRGGIPVQFAQLGALPTDESADQPAPPPADRERKPPPVTITVTEDGRLMLSSPDTAALDKLEQLIEQLSPPEKRFKVYRLQYITALNMYWNLSDYFAEELTGDKEYIYDWWGEPVPVGDKAEGSGLSRRKKLQIIYDTPSNTILVANASARQLREVEQLIAEYDRPAPADSIKSRRTMPVKIRYSRASVIAAALKDVYRDLLSSRDKEFQSGDKKEQAANQERTTIIRYGGGGSDDEGSKRPTPVKLGFEGALSIGVDEIANVLVISAQEEIFDNVIAMVRQLDEEARPRTTVEVHRVSGQIDPKALQKALADSLGTPWPGGRPEKPEAATPAGDKPKPEGSKPSGESSND
jgi:type II secretory pathway component GspD/PulD (secretin)